MFATSLGGGVRQQDGRVADYRSASSPMGAEVSLHPNRGAGSFWPGGGGGQADTAGGACQPGLSSPAWPNSLVGTGKDCSPEGREGQGRDTTLRSNSFTNRMHHTVVRRVSNFFFQLPFQSFALKPFIQKRRKDESSRRFCVDCVSSMRPEVLKDVSPARAGLNTGGKPTVNTQGAAFSAHFIQRSKTKKVSRASRHAPCSKMRGIGKVREFIYTGGSRQSSQEGDPRISSAVSQSRPKSSVHDSLEGHDDDVQGQYMDYAYLDGSLSPRANRHSAIPFAPPPGR